MVADAFAAYLVLRVLRRLVRYACDVSVVRLQFIQCQVTEGGC